MARARKKHPSKQSEEERKTDLRQAVTSADATGLVAGEELITKAETVLPPEKPTGTTKHRP